MGAAIAAAFPLVEPNLTGVLVARLHASGSDISWVADVGFLAAAAAAYLFGSLGDRVGRKRMMIVGATLMAVGEVVSGLAKNVHVMWIGQGIGGIGAGALAALSLAVVMSAARTEAHRTRHLAAFAGSLTGGPIMAALLSGIAGQSGGFEWAYVGMGIVAAVVGLLIALLCSESRQSPPRRIDGSGQVALVIGLCALLWAVIEGAGTHWDRIPIVVAFVVGAVALVAFFVVERRPGGMINLSMLRNPVFSAAALSALVSAAIFTGLNYIYALRITVAQGHTPLFSAWGMILLSAVAGATGFGSRRALSARVGVRVLVVTGFCGFAAVAFWLGAVPITSTSFTALLGVLVISGLSQAMVTAGMSAAAVRSAPPGDDSTAAATQGVMRQAGSPLGIAIAGAIVFTSAQGALAGKLSHLGLSAGSQQLVSGVNHADGVLGVLGAGLATKFPTVGGAAVTSLASGSTKSADVLGITAVVMVAATFVALRRVPRAAAGQPESALAAPQAGTGAVSVTDTVTEMPVEETPHA